jgi:hypothetical protein
MDPKVCRRCGKMLQTKNQQRFHEAMICRKQVKKVFGQPLKAAGLFIYTCKRCDKSMRRMTQLKHGQFVVVIPLCAACRKRNVYK